MQLVPFMKFRNSLAQVQDIGQTPYGRRITYITGEGRFEGPKLRGRILPGGGDWLLKGEDGLSRLDVRKTFETEDSALIHVTYTGLYRFNETVTARLESGQASDFGDTLFVTQVQFDTGDRRYAWLNETLAVGQGRETCDGVEYRVSAIIV